MSESGSNFFNFSGSRCHSHGVPVYVLKGIPIAYFFAQGGGLATVSKLANANLLTQCGGGSSSRKGLHKPWPLSS